MLSWNVVGVFLGCTLTLLSNIDVKDTVTTIVEGRLNIPLISIFTRSIYTGVIMHLCVWMAIYKKTIIPTLIGVPLFILCGLPHCIADVFYYGLTLKHYGLSVLVPWIVSVLGNTLGCKLPSIFSKDMCA